MEKSKEENKKNKNIVMNKIIELDLDYTIKINKLKTLTKRENS